MAHEFESRKQIEEDMMKILRSRDAKMIGICGMGGLGKTSMARRIMKRALDEHLFEAVVMEVVNQQVYKSEFHVESTASSGLKFEVGTSQVASVRNLRLRLSGTKRILVILDDVWQGRELEDLRISSDSERVYTILLTSRGSDVFASMNVDKVFGIETLSEEEAWFMFRERAGTCVDDSELNSIAKQVVRECNGLPIALATVGVALKDEKNASIWEDALRQLRESDPHDIPDSVEKVYKAVKLSYDLLGSKQAKSLFLLLCLFRRNDDIRVKRLTYFCMGLGILGDVRDLEGARYRMQELINMLKSRCLVLDGYDEDGVRMHDVVRDVCVLIAKEEGCIGGHDSTWNACFELPRRRLFLIRDAREIGEGIRDDVHVLCIENDRSFTSLPHPTQPLTNVKTLVLDCCGELSGISAVGEMVNLEILIFRQCSSIAELPPEMKGLNRLKLLQLLWCSNLQRISRGIISSLVSLEELKMSHSFNRWEAEERENVAELRELEALTNLTCLEIEILDPALLAQNMQLSSKIKRFRITMARGSLHEEFKHHPSHKKMNLEVERETRLGDWIEMQLLRDAECLYMHGNGVKNVDLAKCQKIRWLEMGQCERMKNIVTTTVFPSVEYLSLFSLCELQEICEGPIPKNLRELQLIDLAALKQLWKNSIRPKNCVFRYLSSIHIKECPRLRNLGQLSIAGKDCLPQLEILHIWKCEMMEQVFLWNKDEEEDSPNPRAMFPKLKTVWLDRLPNLVTFYQGIQGIEFPLLQILSIEECPKMTIIGSRVDDEPSHLFCQPQQVSFSKLKELVIDRNPFRGHEIPLSLFHGLEALAITKYNGGTTLFTPSIAGNLVALKVLEMFKCHEMVQVIEEEVVSGGERTVLFPSLQRLELNDLPKLESFCEWKCDVEMPSLRHVQIENCLNMRNFSLGGLTTPDLGYVAINYEVFNDTKDLNGALQLRFAKAKEEEEERKKREEEYYEYTDVKEEEEECYGFSDEEEEDYNIDNSSTILTGKGSSSSSSRLNIMGFKWPKNKTYTTISYCLAVFFIAFMLLMYALFC